MTDRNGLVSLVESYSKRSDLTTEIEQQFLPIAEARIGRDLRCAENETMLEVIVTDGSPIPYPANYGQLRAIDVAESGGAFTLRSVDLHSINNFQTSDQGGAQVYTAADSEFIIRPNGSGTFTLFYWARPELPEGTSENAVLDRWPELYLYATLTELHRWEINPAPMQAAAEQYGIEIARINRDAGRALGDKPAMRRA